MSATVENFSKLGKLEKLNFLVENYLDKNVDVQEVIKGFWHPNVKEQQIFDEFAENTITNFYFPYGIVPNVLINGKTHCVPMVIEESSVVAAAAKAGKFWRQRGGIQTKVLDTEKVGQVHFIWRGSPREIASHFERVKPALLAAVDPLLANMKKRGGGLRQLKLLDQTEQEKHYYQLRATFSTCDAMGANLINSVLEALAKAFSESVQASGNSVQIIMAILSNYTPNCLVQAKVSCPIGKFETHNFADKFAQAVRIAHVDSHRAVTHNKGIMNGIDAVILATGNDFRAVEACAHAYAARSGRYRSLSRCQVEDDMFSFELELPLAVGTVGGLTSLHPLARISLDMLQRPSARQLMQIAAAVGLLQNFAAVNSLVTSGIQKGHMKMHLINLLNRFAATDEERRLCKERFKSEIISYNAVKEFLSGLRSFQ